MAENNNLEKKRDKAYHQWIVIFIAMFVAFVFLMIIAMIAANFYYSNRINVTFLPFFSF